MIHPALTQILYNKIFQNEMSFFITIKRSEIPEYFRKLGHFHSSPGKSYISYSYLKITENGQTYMAGKILIGLPFLHNELLFQTL